MLRFFLIAILVVVVARAFWQLLDGVLEAVRLPGGSRPQPPGVKLVRDPVCGTFVAIGTSISVAAGGATQYFCSERCRKAFLEK